MGFSYRPVLASLIQEIADNVQSVDSAKVIYVPGDDWHTVSSRSAEDPNIFAPIIKPALPKGASDPRIFNRQHAIYRRQFEVGDQRLRLCAEQFFKAFEVFTLGNRGEK